MCDIELFKLNDVLACLCDGRITQIYENIKNKKLYSAIYNSYNVKSILRSNEYDEEETKILILHNNNKISYYIYDEKKIKLQLATDCKFIKKIYCDDKYFYAIGNDGTPYFLKPNKNSLSLCKINQNNGQCTQRIVDIVFYNKIISVKTILVGEKGKLYLCSFNNENVTCSKPYQFPEFKNKTIIRAICANNTLAIVTKARKVFLWAIKISNTTTVTKINNVFNGYKTFKDITAENNLFAFLFEDSKIYIKGKLEVSATVFNRESSVTREIGDWLQKLRPFTKNIDGKIARIYLIKDSLYVLNEKRCIYKIAMGDYLEEKCKLIKKLPLRSIETFQTNLRLDRNYYDMKIRFK